MKIDIIYTYVDSTDEEWVKRNCKFRTIYKKTGLNDYNKCVKLLDTIDNDEYMNNFQVSKYDSSLNELKYSIRSLEMYFKDYINNIYIVTNNGKLPSFLKKRDNLIPILYSDLVGHDTYNSIVIESNLHKIKGLGEYYLYLNDDLFLFNKIKLDDFLNNDKQIYYYETNFVIKSYHLLNDLFNEFSMSFMEDVINVSNSNKYTNNILGVKDFKHLAHCPRIFKKTMVYDFCNIFSDEIKNLNLKLFRTETDFSFITAYAHFYRKHGKLKINNNYDTLLYFYTDNIKVNNFINKICNLEINKNTKFMSILDGRAKSDKDENIVQILEKKFNVKSSYEV